MGKSSSNTDRKVEGLISFRATEETYAKSSSDLAQNLPNDQKVKVKVGDIVQARVVETEGGNIVISDGVMNNKPLGTVIKVLHAPHWEKIEEVNIPPGATSKVSPRRAWAKFIKSTAKARSKV
jgi:hypothetical protein